MIYTHQAQQSWADKKPATPERPGKGGSQPNNPTSSDLVSNISISPSERSAAQAIEVPIGTATTAVGTPYDEQDETMAARKRDRSPSPTTRKKNKQRQRQGKKRKTE